MKNNLAVHFSSEKQDWETPKDLFDKLNAEFQFDLDVCASDINKKCAAYFDVHMNGLSLEWIHVHVPIHDGDTGYFYPATCWMNPPYGREIGKWVKKAYEESQRGCTVVALLPARTDTSWFHTYIYQRSGVDIRFLCGRLRFVGAKSSAPFPSMIVVFNPPQEAEC